MPFYPLKLTNPLYNDKYIIANNRIKGMKDEIKNIINKYPKHYSKMIKNDEKLSSWVLQNSDQSVSIFTEQIYTAITNEPVFCENGNKKRFVSVNEGYSFCGKATTCVCCKNSVSKSVSATKQKQTLIQKQKTNAKREKTNLEKYGVTNIGQTATAKQKHKEFYENNSDLAVEKHKKTMLNLYGVDNPAKLKEVQDKKKATNLIKYGVENPMQNPSICQLSLEKRKETFDPIQDIERRYNKFVKMLKNEFGVKVNIHPNEYTGVAVRPKLEFTCLTCNHTFTKRFDYKVPPVCKNCYPTITNYQSKEETEVYDFVKTLLPNQIIVQRDRSTINPYELDIVLPELKIAIEYCGLYWHSEISGNKSWDYHRTKFNLAKEKGYRLITIFSDEWNTRKEIVKSKLTSILGKTNERIFARKCVVKIVPRQDAVLFYNNYHIQGKLKKTGTSIGLYYDNELVAVGSFVKKSETECELVRYASSIRVVAGLSKIIKYLEKNFTYTSIVSFADRRWSEGVMYNSCGFVQVSEVPPMQTYVKNDTRYHKLLFPKARINPNNLPLTEWQVMQSAGYDRIWDCGKIKFMKTINGGTR
jgi:hypothetical protein